MGAPGPRQARGEARLRAALGHLRPGLGSGLSAALALALPAGASAAALALALPSDPAAASAAPGDSLQQLLAGLQVELGSSVALSLSPSNSAAPLVAGHTLFHPKDMAEWLARWSEARPGDGDPMRMLMAPEGESFKRAPLIIKPGSAANASSAFLQSWCDEHRAQLAAATDACGALLFRGWNLAEVDDYEAAMDGLGVKTSDFVGTAPRGKVGRYVLRNVSFESAAAEKEPVPLDHFRTGADVVWAEGNMQFFNFHNELAYVDAEHHKQLNFANYALFCCVQPSAIGGYTIVSDARRVHSKLKALLGADAMPTEFKFVIARKSLNADVLKKESGDYAEFLCGDW